jgi:chromosome segregation ATPase
MRQETEIEKIQNDEAFCIDYLNHLTLEVSELKEKIANLEKEKMIQTSVCKTLQKQFDEKNSKVNELKSHIQHNEKQIENLKPELMIKKERYISIQNEIAYYEQSIDDLELKLAKLKAIETNARDKISKNIHN